jgi:anaerobic selenocysteine-containing dehydrogenase
MRSERSFCRICPAFCGIVVEFESDGSGKPPQRVVKVRGDRDHPASRGYACVKGYGLPRMHHHADGLERPLIRKGGKLVETTWDACLDDLAGRLRRVIERRGADGVGVFFGTGVGIDAAGYFAGERLLAGLGTRQRYSPMTIDSVARRLVADLVAGFAGLDPRPDREHVRLVLYVGVNPVVSHGHAVGHPDPVRALRALGERAEVWAIDPRRTETARFSTRHLAPRPGTDFAILAFLARELLRSGMDRDYVAAWSVDADRLRAAVEPFSAARAAEITGLPARELEELLEVVRRVGRLAIESGTGVTMSRAGNVTQWLAWVVMILTGSFNRPGGVWFHPGFMSRRDNVDLPISPPGGMGGPVPASRPDLSGFMEYPCAALPDEILSGNVEAFLNLGGAIVNCFPDTRRLLPALRKLDVLASFDIIAGETTELSTHVLPVKDQLERTDATFWDFLSPEVDARYTPAIVEPLGERRSVWWVLAEIGRRLGHELFPELGPNATDEDVIALRMSNARVSFEELTRRRYVRSEGERDDSWFDRHIRRLGGLRLAPEILVEQLATLAGVEDEALVLVPRRQPRQFNAQLRYLGERPDILVHPDDARRAGLVDRAEAWVRSAYGELRGVVRFDAQLRRGAVSIPHGYAEPNVNCLTSKDDVDPITGMPRFSGVEVSLAPVGADASAR